MNLGEKIATIMLRPEIAADYLGYLVAKMTRMGNPHRKVWAGTKVAGFHTFSHFHAIKNFVTRDEFDFFSNLKPEPRTIIDIGANIGVISCILGKLYPNCEIFAFEPAESTCNYARHNVKLNNLKQVKVIQSAVGDRVGTVKFAWSDLHRNTASICSANYIGSATEVPITTLDSFISAGNLNKVDLIKVDVEGYEEDVFAGAAKSLAKRVLPIIYYEASVGPAGNAGRSIRRPTEMLCDFGYRIFTIKPGGVFAEKKVADIGNVDSENIVAILK